MSFHPIEGLMYLAPASLVWMVLFAAIFEWPSLLRDGALGIVIENPGLFMAAATMGFGVMLLSFFTIQLCGSLTLKVRHSGNVYAGACLFVAVGPCWCVNSALLARARVASIKS
jgi:hypothetical protein